MSYQIGNNNSLLSMYFTVSSMFKEINPFNKYTNVLKEKIRLQKVTQICTMWHQLLGYVALAVK